MAKKEDIKLIGNISRVTNRGNDVSEHILNMVRKIDGIQYEELIKENETLRTEKAALEQALDELLFLKVLKDKSGKTPEYLERQPKAWTAAMQVLDTLEA
jgi:regulator of replication initiation timing